MQAEGEEVQLLKYGDFMVFTVMQIAATEGEKTCSNLEQGVLKWFQRRENQKDAKRLKLRGESLVRYHVAEEYCYCRGWLQLTKDHKGNSTRMWVELLRIRRSI